MIDKNLMISILIILLIIDFLILIIFVFIYSKFKKFMELPWEEIRESVERAQELVKKLEELQQNKEYTDKKEIINLVYQLNNQGYSIREIARKLRISEAEVEIILSSKRNK
ncbi:MAG: hypothetical protein DRP29_04020 [Thermodesulfobacteriota bacterium]|nr:MAG: hypothetical protein DRP29_04020 [Thermodesulfobacteriota bacterium]RLG09808.1 MAG: hypothetical protein DRN73_09290 [Candidatus Pacearchaeota archaeon]